jgi:hypothetical protein
MRRIEQANKFELVLNMEALGNAVPRAELDSPTKWFIKCGCPLMAQSGHALPHCTCLLSGVKRDEAQISAFAVALGVKRT